MLFFHKKVCFTWMKQTFLYVSDARIEKPFYPAAAMSDQNFPPLLPPKPPLLTEMPESEFFSIFSRWWVVWMN